MPRTSLQTQLDRDVLQIIQKFREDKPDSELKTFLVYNYIARSNSALRRRPKIQLEESIERCISVIQLDDESPEPSVTEKTTEGSRARAVSPGFMNRLVVDSWSNSSGRNQMRVTKREQPANGESGIPRKRRRQRDDEAPVSTVDTEAYSLYDIGGVDAVQEQLSELLLLPLLQPQIYIENNFDIPRGILLHGPPGCGKTTLARAFAAASGVPFIEILGPSVVSGMSGESEQNVRERFDDAKRLAPSIIFIDEIDVIAPKRDQAGSQMEKRIVAQLLICMDELAHHRNGGKPVIVIGATNRPDALDPSLRRGGRFNAEINMGVPNEEMRESILRAKMRKIPHGDDIDYKALARMTAGYVGADLTDLVSQSGAWALKNYSKALLAQAASIEDTESDEMQLDGNVNDKASKVSRNIYSLVRLLRSPDHTRPPGYESGTPLITMDAFNAALKVVQPSALREGFTTVPKTTWADVGALEDVRKKLMFTIVDPIRSPEKYAAAGLRRPGGVLLWGPPGCGKTLLAKAVANESKANFIAVKGAELLNKYLGESERAVRTVFMRARSSAPCVLFFDELDAIASRRDSGESGEGAVARVVGALLIELDGLGGRDGIYVIGATNRKDMIDEAMLRAGRFGTQIFVGLPDALGRVNILKTLLAKNITDSGQEPHKAILDLAEIAAGSEYDGLSGADLDMLVQTAGQTCVRRNGVFLEKQDFEAAIQEVKPSVRNYKRFLKMAEEAK